MIVVVESSSVSFQGAQLDNDVTLYAQPIPNESWIQDDTNSFGTTVAASGNYVVVGDPTYKTQVNGKQYQTGTVYVYYREGQESDYVFIERISPPEEYITYIVETAEAAGVSRTDIEMNFGMSVDVQESKEDGKHKIFLIIGMPNEYESSQVFTYIKETAKEDRNLVGPYCILGQADCSRSGIQYSLNSKEPSYGQSVAIKNYFAVVGSPNAHNGDGKVNIYYAEQGYDHDEHDENEVEPNRMEWISYGNKVKTVLFGLF